LDLFFVGVWVPRHCWPQLEERNEVGCPRTSSNGTSQIVVCCSWQTSKKQTKIIYSDNINWKTKKTIFDSARIRVSWHRQSLVEKRHEMGRRRVASSLQSAMTCTISRLKIKVIQQQWLANVQMQKKWSDSECQTRKLWAWRAFRLSRLKLKSFQILSSQKKVINLLCQMFDTK
jgi:hypothetical protein